MGVNDKNRITAYSFDANELTLVGGLACPEGGGPVDTDDTSGALYDARLLKPLNEMDVQDVMDLGVHTPIVVRKDGERIVVIAGRNRVRWAREASKRLGTPVKVPCVFRTGKDKDVAGILVSENEHRDEDSFENRANKAKRLLDLGATEEEVCTRMRITMTGLKNYLAFFDLDDKVQDDVRAGAVSASAAIQLSSLPRGEQVQEMIALKEEAKASGEAQVRVDAVAQRARVKKAEKKGKPVEEAGSVRPKIRTLRRVMQHEAIYEVAGGGKMAEGFLLGLRYALGDVAPERVKGLTAILREANGSKKAAGEVLFNAGEDE